MADQTDIAGEYVIREARRDFISLIGNGGIVTRPAFDVVFRDSCGTETRTGIDRVAASDKPLHVAAARRSAEAQVRNLRAYAERMGVRWEVERAAKAKAKRDAERAEADARKRVREAAPALLEALRKAQAYIGEHDDADDLAEVCEAIDAAIAAAEGRAS